MDIMLKVFIKAAEVVEPALETDIRNIQIFISQQSAGILNSYLIHKISEGLFGLRPKILAEGRWRHTGQ